MSITIHLLVFRNVSEATRYVNITLCVVDDGVRWVNSCVCEVSGAVRELPSRIAQGSPSTYIEHNSAFHASDSVYAT